MPTYDYECRHCGYSFEAFQKITDEPLGSCPKCGKAVRRLIGGGLGIIFKGSGFYTTDYKNSSKLMSGGNGSPEKDTKKDSETKSPEKKEKKVEKSSTEAKSS